MESQVGEFKAWVKSKPNYGNRGTETEAIGQARAAYVSEEGRLQRYFTQRPGNPYH